MSPTCVRHALEILAKQLCWAVAGQSAFDQQALHGPIAALPMWRELLCELYPTEAVGGWRLTLGFQLVQNGEYSTCSWWIESG